MPAVRIASNHLTGPLSRPVSSPVLPHPSGSSGPRGIGPAGCRGGACSGPGRGGLGTVMLRRRGGRQPGPGPGPGPADRARRIGAVARRRSRLWRPLGLLRSLVHVRPPRAVRFSVPLMGSILCDTQLLLQICCVRFATSAITRWLGEHRAITVVGMAQHHCEPCTRGFPWFSLPSIVDQLPLCRPMGSDHAERPYARIKYFAGLRLASLLVRRSEAHLASSSVLHPSKAR